MKSLKIIFWLENNLFVSCLLEHCFCVTECHSKRKSNIAWVHVYALFVFSKGKYSFIYSFIFFLLLRVVRGSGTWGKYDLVGNLNWNRIHAVTHEFVLTGL